jgi:membrane-bound metal-dependent hydrolase YbcI (DUF457 family)
MCLAYPLRWLVYYPTLYILTKILPRKYRYKLRDEHHATTHTLLGTGIATIVLYIMTLFILFLVNKSSYAEDLFELHALIGASVVIGFLIGVIIHFMQDAFSKYGITPLEPFNSLRIYGNYSSWNKLNTKDRTMSTIIFFLLLLIPVYTKYLIKNTATLFTASTLIALFSLSIILIVFLAFGIEFKVKVQSRKKKTRLKKYLVKVLVLIIVLNLVGYIFFVDTGRMLDLKKPTTVRTLYSDDSTLEVRARQTCELACQNNGGVSFQKPVQITNQMVDCICKDGTVNVNNIVIS